MGWPALADLAKVPVSDRTNAGGWAGVVYAAIELCYAGGVCVNQMYDAATAECWCVPIDLARLILGARQPKHGPSRRVRRCTRWCGRCASERGPHEYPHPICQQDRWAAANPARSGTADNALIALCCVRPTFTGDRSACRRA